jgi:hypothetical protein
MEVLSRDKPAVLLIMEVESIESSLWVDRRGW